MHCGCPACPVRRYYPASWGPEIGLEWFLDPLQCRIHIYLGGLATRLSQLIDGIECFVLEKQYFARFGKCQNSLVWFAQNLLSRLLDRCFHCLSSLLRSTSRVLNIIPRLRTSLEDFLRLSPKWLPYRICLFGVLVASSGHSPSTFGYSFLYWLRVIAVVGPERCAMLKKQFAGALHSERSGPEPRLDASCVLCALLENLWLKIFGGTLRI